MVVVGGEISTKAHLDIQKIVRDKIKRIGYDHSDKYFDYQTCSVLNTIHEQSPDISQGVSEGEGLHKEQGAGDQGLMFGYATNETPELMPLSIVLAHKLTLALTETRKTGQIPYLRPDGKSQVTVEYESGKPLRINTALVSVQHSKDVDYETIKNDLTEKVIKPICSNWIDNETKFLVNPTGRFEIGGPHGDTGLTGRKIIVDTYGGHGSHGGGCFSGKDPSKVDRSASYAARYIAKNIVAAGLADKCEVQLAYAIGVAEPVSVLTHCFRTNKIPEEKIADLVRQHFPLKPADIINQLDLKRPIFEKTSAYGHFGRDDPDFKWENLDKAELLKTAMSENETLNLKGEEVPLDSDELEEPKLDQS
jgi:S-adenosylmethionine synthetase